MGCITWEAADRTKTRNRIRPQQSNTGRIQTRDMLIGHSRISPYVPSNVLIASRLDKCGPPTNSPNAGCLHRQLHDRLFNVRLRAVLQTRLAPADLLESHLAPFLVQFLEPVE